MCGPQVALAVVGMAFQMYQGQQQAQQYEQQAKYEEAVQRNNNIMAERAAQDAEQRGRREEALKRMQISQEVGSAKSALAGSGFDVNTGSALTKQSDIAAMGEVEALTIRDNAQREAYGVRTGNAAQRAESQGRVYGLKNKASSSLISAATSVGKSAYSHGKSGTFGKTVSGWLN